MHLLFAAGGLLLAILFAGPAAAATVSPSITIPWGDWAASLLMTVAALIVPLITWALRFLPAQLQALIRTVQVEQLLGKAVSYGLNATAGAARGKVLTVDVGNQVLAEAVHYAVEHGPDWADDWLGGEAGIRDRIIARLDLDQSAALK